MCAEWKLQLYITHRYAKIDASRLKTTGARPNGLLYIIMNNMTQNIWGTKVEQNITETVALYIAFTSVAGVQGIAAEEAVEKQFSGEQFDDADWASL